MPRRWRLTRQAEESLTEIARWTLDVFGPRQAAAYEQDLVERCTGIASGTVVSRSCRQLVDPELPENLRFCRCGGHFIVFLENTDAVIVLDFIHARSDLPHRLASLSGAISPNHLNS